MGGFADFKRAKTGRQLGKIETHLAEKLAGAEWGSFELRELFNSYNGDFDIKKEHINGVGDFVITAGLTDNGVLGKTDISARIFPKQTITVDMFGCAFYRDFPYKMVTHARVFNLTPKFDISDNQGLFIANSLRFLQSLFGYENMCSWAKIKDLEISLPQSNGKIDFSFMEIFIAELKALRVTELKALRVTELHAYLQATGLSNYTLSDDEQAALKAIKTAKWQIFNVEDLFGKATRGKRLKSADRISGSLPFVTAGEADTGISAFIGNDVERFKPNTVTIDMFGSAKYRNYEYGADDHIAVVHTDHLPKHTVLFLTSAMHKVANAGQFSYARNFYAKDADALNIELPLKDGKPDWVLMANYLQAIEKLVIKDVVDWADKEIATTESVI